MGAGPFWIENRKLENHNLKKKYLMIIGLKKNKKWIGVVGRFAVSFFQMLIGCLDFFNFARPLNDALSKGQ